MNDQAQAVGDDAVLAQLEGYLEAEEATPEPEEEELEASPEETEESEEESEEADEETEAPEEEVLELNWNGELKAFKKSEVVELAQKVMTTPTRHNSLQINAGIWKHNSNNSNSK